VQAAVRTLLRILESKGHLRHEQDGTRHVYFPRTPRNIAQRNAIRHLLGTFFDGSRAAAVAALLADNERPLTSAERAELNATIRRLRAAGD
jgi:predicted transcriptional regulator